MSMDGEVSAISTTASAHHHGNRDEHSKYDKALVVYSPMAAVIMRARTESMVTGGANELNEYWRERQRNTTTQRRNDIHHRNQWENEGEPVSLDVATKPVHHSSFFFMFTHVRTSSGVAGLV